MLRCMDVAAAVRSLGGVARTGELRSRGILARDLAVAVHTGAVQRVRRGTFASPDLSVTELHSVMLGGRLACTSVAALRGLWTVPDARLHTLVAPTAARLIADERDVVHWDSPWPMDTRASVSLPHALVQMATCAGDEAFLIALESALRIGALSRRDLREMGEHLPLRLRRIAAFAIRVSDSGLETAVRWRLMRVGIDARAQVHVAGVGRVDLLIGRSFIVEIDGRAFHSGPALSRDYGRDAASARLGYVTQRFDYFLVMHSWQVVEDAVVSFVRRGYHLLPVSSAGPGAVSPGRRPGSTRMPNR